MKPMRWMGSSLKDVRAFPVEVRQAVGYGLYLAQHGGKHANAKSLRGFGSAGVIEIVDDLDGNAYPAVYTVTLPRAVYVLHAFQKKATRGTATPQREIALIRARLHAVQALDQQTSGKEPAP